MCCRPAAVQVRQPSHTRDVPWRAARPGGQVVRTSRPRIPNRQCPSRTPRARPVEPGRRRAPPRAPLPRQGPTALRRQEAGSCRQRTTRGRAFPTPGAGRGHRAGHRHRQGCPERRGQALPEARRHARRLLAAVPRKLAAAVHRHDRRLPAAAPRKVAAAAPRKVAAAAHRHDRRPLGEWRKRAAALPHDRPELAAAPHGRPARSYGAWAAA